MKRLGIAVAASMASMLAAASAGAQGQTCTATSSTPCTATVTASATVPDILQLSLSAATTDLGAPTMADFDAGYRDAAGPTATVKANRAYAINVVGATSTFSATTGGNASKSAADLLWGTTAGTYGNNMGTSALFKGGSATASSGTLPIYFRTKWAYASDSPATYTLVVNYTLSAP